MTVKRKGSDYGDAPSTTIITSILPNKSTISAALNDRVSSDDTMHLCKTLLDYSNESNSTRKVTECLFLDRSDELREQSLAIQNIITAAINASSKRRDEELFELSCNNDKFSSLQTEVKTQRETNDILNSQNKDIEENIRKYQDESAQTIELLDDLEDRKKKEVPRLKRQVSIHAVATGIRWDYDRVDALVGELEVPNKKMHRKFMIDTEELTDFQIANKMWDMIEGY